MRGHESDLDVEKQHRKKGICTRRVSCPCIYLVLLALVLVMMVIGGILVYWKLSKEIEDINARFEESQESNDRTLGTNSVAMAEKGFAIFATKTVGHFGEHITQIIPTVRFCCNGDQVVVLTVVICRIDMSSLLPTGWM